MGWLTLTRRNEQELICLVPPSAEPTVIKVKVFRGGHVRLGTLAPKTVDVVRGDNYKPKRDEVKP